MDIGDHRVRQRIFGVYRVAPAFYRGQVWSHQLTRSIERVVVAAGGGPALHRRSLCWHSNFSFQHYTHERCEEAAGNGTMLRALVPYQAH